MLSINAQQVRPENPAEYSHDYMKQAHKQMSMRSAQYLHGLRRQLEMESPSARTNHLTGFHAPCCSQTGVRVA